MCMLRMFAFMSAVVTVQGSVGMFVVYRELLKVVGSFFIVHPNIILYY